jgi:hypothetical protein
MECGEVILGSGGLADVTIVVDEVVLAGAYVGRYRERIEPL